MKRKIIATLLSLALIAAILSMPIVAYAAPAETERTAAYRAYYDVLKEATDEFGIGENPRKFEWGDGDVLVGVLYAELIRFGNSALPQLVYHYDSGYAPNHYVSTVVVYGYTTKAEQFQSSTVGGHGHDVFLVTDRNGVSYLQEVYYGGFYGEDEPGSEQYYTVRNGRWVEVKEAEIDIATIRELSVINADSVHAVLTELQSTQASPPPGSQTVYPTKSTVYLNGEAKAFEAYLIDGSNYFKLRDLAFVLDGTQKQFEVGYDNATRAITLTSGKSYTAVGDEMAQGDGTSKNAAPTPSTIYLNGAVLDLIVYNINGNNFFKLRDLMEAIDVHVGYDNATRAITLDTSKGYVAE